MTTAHTIVLVTGFCGAKPLELRNSDLIGIRSLAEKGADFT